MKKLATVLFVLLFLVGCSGSGSGSGSSSNQSSNVKQDIEITDSYIYSGEFRDGYVITLYNPNENYDIMFPEITITYMDADGKMIDYDEWTVSSVAPLSKATYCDDFYTKEEYVSVEVGVKTSEDNIRKPSERNVFDETLFEYEDLNFLDDKIVGTLVNNSDKSYSDVMAVFIYKLNGEVVGARHFFIDDVPANDSIHFSTFGKTIDHDEVEIHTNRWGS